MRREADERRVAVQRRHVPRGVVQSEHLFESPIRDRLLEVKIHPGLGAGTPVDAEGPAVPVQDDGRLGRVPPQPLHGGQHAGRVLLRLVPGKHQDPGFARTGFRIGGGTEPVELHAVRDDLDLVREPGRISDQEPPPLLGVRHHGVRASMEHEPDTVPGPEAGRHNAFRHDQREAAPGQPRELRIGVGPLEERDDRVGVPLAEGAVDCERPPQLARRKAAHRHARRLHFVIEEPHGPVGQHVDVVAPALEKHGEQADLALRPPRAKRIYEARHPDRSSPRLRVRHACTMTRP